MTARYDRGRWRKLADGLDFTQAWVDTFAAGVAAGLVLSQSLDTARPMAPAAVET